MLKSRYLSHKKLLKTRRRFLQSGSAMFVLVTGGIVYRAADQGVLSTSQGPAYEPWLNWRSEKSQGPLELVRAAILAASPHNTQPWLFHVTQSAIDLYVDQRRNIGAMDPFLREMYIGVGCALENLVLAAGANGYALTVTLMPDRSDPSYAARLGLTPARAKKVSPLYNAIPHRHTNRAAYDTTKPIQTTTLEAMRALNDDPDVAVFWFASPAARQRVGHLTVAATEAIVEDAVQSHDSGMWFRHNWSAIQQHRDGVTPDASGLPLWLDVISKMLPSPSQEQSHAQWLKATKQQHVATAAAFGLLAVHDNQDDAQRLRGGRLWQRMHLWATTQNLAMHPMNQLCERADRERQLRIEPHFETALQELIQDSEWQALMPFRIGYPTSVSLPSPRRAVQDVIL